MFTQAMPAYIDALRQTVPAGQVMPTAQALGNCQQPLTHRGGINFAPSFQRQASGQPGVYVSQAWNPSTYSGLFPYAGEVGSGAGESQGIDLAGMEANWNNGNRYDSQFYFPTNQWFTQNQFFGGPQVNIQGGAQVDELNVTNINADTVSSPNLLADRINQTPVKLPPGPSGGAGRDGRPGAPGFPGRNGAVPPGFFAPLRYHTGINPRVAYRPERAAREHRYVGNCWIRGATLIEIPASAISVGAATLNIETVTVDVPYNITFDPDLCEVTYDTTTVQVLASSTVGVTINAEPAPTAAYWVGLTGATTLADAVTDGAGFMLKNKDQDFWRNTRGVVVAADPELRGVINAERRVFQQ